MNTAEPKNIQHYGFLLLNNFALMSYASATEPLRAANLLAGREIYRISTLSLDGGPVRSSGGMPIACEKLSAVEKNLNAVFVCAGGGPTDWDLQTVCPAVRRLARRGLRLGGISGGPFVLAAAGVLDGHAFTIHWEHAVALTEAFPHLRAVQARFLIDGNRITCGGGVAPLDMMHAMIAEHLGSEFARRVSDWYLHTAIAEPTSPQRASLIERYGVHHPVLIEILRTMESTLERPLTRAQMAKSVSLSTRHLDRLFVEQLDSTFLAKYRELRLRHARRLLQQSPLSISEIAFATGFCSAAHFSRSFKAFFSLSPKALRK